MGELLLKAVMTLCCYGGEEEVENSMLTLLRMLQQPAAQMPSHTHMP